MEIQYQVKGKAGTDSVQCFNCQITQWCKGNSMFCPLSLQFSVMWENMKIHCLQKKLHSPLLANHNFDVKVLVMICSDFQFLHLDLWSLNHMTVMCFLMNLYREIPLPLFLLILSRLFSHSLSPCSCLCLFIFDGSSFLPKKSRPSLHFCVWGNYSFTTQCLWMENHHKWQTFAQLLLQHCGLYMS